MQVTRLLSHYDPAARIDLRQALVKLIAMGFLEEIKREIRESAIDTLLTNGDSDGAVKVLSTIHIENRFVIRLHGLIQEILSQGGASEL